MAAATMEIVKRPARDLERAEFKLVDGSIVQLPVRLSMSAAESGFRNRCRSQDRLRVVPLT